MPNALAYVALIVWPLVILIMFRRLSTERALIWSILGGYLLLPPVARFDPPLIPLLDKATIPTLTAFVICAKLYGRGVVALPKSRPACLLLLLFIVSPAGTVITNFEPILFARGGMPGLSIQDALSAMLSQIITILPFLLAGNLLATERAQREILVALMVAGLAYSIPMLVEIRLSPQLNVWIYGFFQHGFDQMIRYGGYRPIVFLEHGLWVAFFALMAFCSALALARLAPPEERMRRMMVAIYLGVMLVLCKSASPLIYACLLVPLLLFASSRTQLRVAALLATIVVAYPLLRSFELVPVDGILSLARSIDLERASSLQFRLENEEMLLRHASSKPIFGWGAWGRNFVYDFVTGDRITTVDGRWIVVIGISGYLGYLAEFGLLALPALALLRQAGRGGVAAIPPYAGPLSLIFAANLVDLLPNATLIPFTWLIAGALHGYAQALRTRTPTVHDARVAPMLQRRAKAGPRSVPAEKVRKAGANAAPRRTAQPCETASPREAGH